MREYESNVNVFNVSEYDLKDEIVTKKFRDVKHEDIPETNSEMIKDNVLEGDKDMKEVDNGGYNVHPVPPPNSEIIDRISIR